MENFEDYAPVDLSEGSTSYFSVPESALDPSLFDGSHMKPDVRSWIISTVHGFLAKRYMHPESWTRLWVAGSGVSFQWAADRDPADLDVMLGVDYVRLRQSNPDLSGFSDLEIARLLNQQLHDELYPQVSHTSIGHSNFEVTVYVNPGVGSSVDDLKIINPYAAYDVTQDEWSVPPNPKPMIRVHPSWDVSVETDRQRADEILRRYGDLLTQVQNATNPAHRVNAEKAFKEVVEDGAALFDQIHSGRKAAFSPAGNGYSDFSNYRWQSGKRTGVVQAMRRLKDYQTADKEREDFESYGLNFPTTDVLVERAVSSYRNTR